MHVTVLPLFGEAYLQRLGAICSAYLRSLSHLLQSRRFDLLWIEYQLFPWLRAWSESLLVTLDIPCFIGYDNIIFHAMIGISMVSCVPFYEDMLDENYFFVEEGKT